MSEEMMPAFEVAAEELAKAAAQLSAMPEAVARAVEEASRRDKQRAAAFDPSAVIPQARAQAEALARTYAANPEAAQASRREPAPQKTPGDVMLENARAAAQNQPAAPPAQLPPPPQPPSAPAAWNQPAAPAAGKVAAWDAAGAVNPLNQKPTSQSEIDAAVALAAAKATQPKPPVTPPVASAQEQSSAAQAAWDARSARAMAAWEQRAKPSAEPAGNLPAPSVLAAAAQARQQRDAADAVEQASRNNPKHVAFDASAAGSNPLNQKPTSQSQIDAAVAKAAADSPAPIKPSGDSPAVIAARQRDAQNATANAGPGAGTGALQKASEAAAKGLMALYTAAVTAGGAMATISYLGSRASPTHMATLQTSMDLLAARIGQHILPGLEEASRTIQGIARNIPDPKKEIIGGRNAFQIAFPQVELLKAVNDALGTEPAKLSYKAMPQPQIGTAEQAYDRMTLASLGQGPAETELLQLQLQALKDVKEAIVNLQGPGDVLANPFR